MSVDLSGLTSPYSDILKDQLQNSEKAKLQNTVSADYSNSTEEELMTACKQFEAYFLEQVFKGMEKTVMKADDGDGASEKLVDYFKDHTIQEMAAQSTETNSLGLAQMLFEQMKRNYGITDVTENNQQDEKMTDSQSGEKQTV